MKGRFRGVYGRQLAVTLGTALLALAMLGFGCCFVTLRYFHFVEERETAEKAAQMAALCVEYLREDRALREQHLELRGEELESRPYYQKLEGFHRAISDKIHFLICDAAGRVLSASDPALEGRVLTMPEAWMERIAAGETVRAKAASIGFRARFVLGVPVRGAFHSGASAKSAPDSGILDSGAAVPDSEIPDSGIVEGAVFAFPAGSSLSGLWKAMAVVFCLTALIVLTAGTVASARAASRMARPLGEMLQATRQYSERDFSVRMNGDGKEDEIGELTASFNEMAESLQRQELRRREFMSDVSHDLKTPLTTIAGYTDGILDGTIPPESQRKYLQIISEESRRLSRMVRRMLDVSQYQAIDPLRGGNSFELCERARQVIISMEKKITDRNLDVDADIPYGPIYVYGDSDMITQVLYNLLENAAKFATEGSTLYLGVAERDDKAQVTVRNQGETIPPEEIPLLFERFHKSDKSRSVDKDGVGLGLYIVKTILDQHREKIFASSENGVTEFAFSLRIARGNGKYA